MSSTEQEHIYHRSLDHTTIIERCIMIQTEISHDAYDEEHVIYTVFVATHDDIDDYGRDYSNGERHTHDVDGFLLNKEEALTLIKSSMDDAADEGFVLCEERYFRHKYIF